MILLIIGFDEILLLIFTFFLYFCKVGKQQQKQKPIKPTNQPNKKPTKQQQKTKQQQTKQKQQTKQQQQKQTNKLTSKQASKQKQRRNRLFKICAYSCYRVRVMTDSWYVAYYFQRLADTA